MKRIAAACAALLLMAGPAAAACAYQGTYYEVGTKICFGGWLQECTVANYWKAIGMCHRPDARPGERGVRFEPLRPDLIKRLKLARADD